MIPSLKDIKDARPIVARSAIRTPLVRLNVINAPAEIYLKLENLQPIGSFKIPRCGKRDRSNVRRDIGKRRLDGICRQHGRGVAWQARELGIPCTVIHA